MPEDTGRVGERALVAAIVAGDERAFEQLYRDLKPRLLRAAGHFLGHNDPGAEDAVHDALAAALPHFKDFRFESSLYTWLNRFVVNFCYHQLNKRKKSVLAETIQLEGWSKPLNPSAPEGLKRAIAGELEQLSPEHAQVIRLRDLEGRSYEETAKELGLAVGTVMSRLARARAALKPRLEKRKAMYAAFLESLMTDPRLSRLAQLWAQGLEGALAAAEEVELKGLLDDAALAEAWVEQQAAPRGEDKPAGALPGRLRSAFQRQYRPLTYWGLRVGVPALLLLLFFAWPRAKAPLVLNAVEDAAPFQKAEAPTQAERPDLGPPPGLDEHQHLWVTRQVPVLSLDYRLPHPGQLKVLVRDAQGKTRYSERVRTHGDSQGSYRWDGRSKAGERLPAGSYKVQLLLDGTLLEEKDLRLENK